MKAAARILAIVALIIAFSLSAAQQPAAKGVPAERWEYGAFFTLPKGAEMEFVWFSGPVVVEKVGGEAFADAMLANKLITSRPRKVAEVLNALGNEGWELVQITRNATLQTDVYHFKRRTFPRGSQ